MTRKPGAKRLKATKAEAHGIHRIGPSCWPASLPDRCSGNWRCMHSSPAQGLFYWPDAARKRSGLSWRLPEPRRSVCWRRPCNGCPDWSWPCTPSGQTSTGHHPVLLLCRDPYSTAGDPGSRVTSAQEAKRLLSGADPAAETIVTGTPRGCESRLLPLGAALSVTGVTIAALLSSRRRRPVSTTAERREDGSSIGGVSTATGRGVHG